ncbi:MAG: hypothetical protein D3922_01705 [Candidatus Electrothrix sp. AR1]|nr:hypothetical protein [Candidatus Electrothrix sp. AR1]
MRDNKFSQSLLLNNISKFIRKKNITGITRRKLISSCSGHNLRFFLGIRGRWHLGDQNKQGHRKAGLEGLNHRGKSEAVQ